MIREELKKRLHAIKEDKPWITTPGEVIKMAGWNRRSWRLSEEVELLLNQYRLTSSPSFTNAYVHSRITIAKKPAPNTPLQEEKKEEQPHPAALFRCENCDPIPRLSRLRSANLRHPEDRNKISLVSINREAPIEEAITLMIKYNFSQLPIMNNSRRVEGLVSWRSIGKAKCLGKKITRVYDCKERVDVFSIYTPLLEVVEQVQKNEVVLVKDTDDVICGIITATDITEQFLAQAEPFFLIQQIEKLIRIILNRSGITLEEMCSLLDPAKLDKKIRNVSDFTFGQYLLILENEALFSRLNLAASRLKLLEYLKQIHEVRNEVMHFAIDEIPVEDLKHLRETLHLLIELIR